MALRRDRLNKVAHLLQQRGSVTTAQLSGILGVTGMTIRRDLDELERQGVVARTHGGAVLAKHSALMESPFLTRSRENVEYKKKIARYAASQLVDGQRIFIASGSTLDLFAQSIDPSLRLSVVTNALNVPYALLNHREVYLIVLGGEFRQTTLSNIGSAAEDTLDRFKFDTAFLGVTALDASGNIFQSGTVEISLSQKIHSLAKNTVILADSTKLGREDFVYLDRLEHGYTLVTNDDAQTELVESYRALGADVVLV